MTENGNPTPHIMIDTETLGLHLFSPITSIAAVAFHPDPSVDSRRSDLFHVAIDHYATPLDVVEKDTLEWRLRHKVNKVEADLAAYNWLEVNDLLFRVIHPKGIIWFKHPEFDIPRITLQTQVPWHYRNVRDVSTYAWAAGQPSPHYEGAHGALIDCHRQIDMVQDACYALHYA